MKIGLIGYGKMNRLVEKACKQPIVCITKDFVKDFGADVYIDFSHGTLVERNALLLAQKGKCHIIGTTGWESPKVAAAFAENGAGLYCPNFSREMARFIEAVSQLTQLLGPPNKATEQHHRSKKDTPSGTAKMISAITGVPFEAMRVDETVFRHSLVWGETNLTHEAFDRKSYVSGALEAVNWIYGRKGWYDDFFGHLHPANHTLS